MLFNSYIFIFVFLPISLGLFFFLSRLRLVKAAVVWITISSFFFYSYWDITALPLILISVVFNYYMGEAINAAPDKGKQAKLLLWIGVVINVLLIAYYKYANFILDSVNFLINTNIHLEKITLPIGISFYTFTQIAYLVDAYKGEIKDCKYDLMTYSLFIVFFPQLIAGPIVRHEELVYQFSQLRNFVFSHKNIAIGLTVFSIGLAKKVLIADNISPWVAPVFTNSSQVSFLEAWVGALSYTFQLYFDFSGYSDMAVGLGYLFNIKLPINFDSPYKANSISDFWRRWHITLSNFLRDYLYIPLGGSRQGELRRYLNLFTTMLLGGLWHGAGWTYVIWGGLHGLYLCINHAWRKLKKPLPKILAWGITFISVIVAWVIFRATNFQQASDILQAMFGMKGITLPGEAKGKLAMLAQFGIQLKSWKDLVYIPEVNGSKVLSLATLLLLTLATVYLPNTQDMMKKFQPNWWWAVLIGFITSLSLLSLNRVSEFLYFQF